MLILHGLAHASAGMWATDIGGHSLVTILWEGATLGFMLAGAGLIGVKHLHKHWKALAVFASISSLVLLLLYGHPLFILGIAADFTVMAVALIASRLALPSSAGVSLPIKVALAGLIVYTGAIIALRPWYSSWGTTRSERQMVMIGDPPLGQSHYRIDHAVTVNAPADSVWPWIAQIGQDRAGFYSYDWLERLFGAKIHNADAIVPEWQDRQVGQMVRAVQPEYMKGVFGSTLGWKITHLEPGRAMVLEKWGAFAVEPIDSGRSRIHIRTRGAGIPTPRSIVIAPISLLTLEPAHFIMERGMLLGIKQRAESPRSQ